MTSHWLFQLAVLAIGGFWVVGAYNRLMRLRNALMAAWDQIEPPLLRRSEAIATVVAAVREPLAAEAGTLQALADADAKQRAAAEAVKGARASVATVAGWVAAEAALASPASRLRALLELQRPELPEPLSRAVTQALAAWVEAEPRIGFARQAFNDAAAAYNAALHQWPTRLLTALFGHHDAGRA